MVSAIIPVRNEEASIARTVESVAAQPEVGEIIVINDQSTDGTPEILSRLGLTIPKLRSLHVEGLPPGWVGKNYAVSLGAAAARGEWLLFTDADTYHMLGSARRALNDAVEHNAVLVSYSPEQELGSFWERALIPVVYLRLAARYPFDRVNNPGLPDAAANGQFLMILRDVYEQVGGHGAIASQILEDVALASRVKSAGYGIYFTAPMATVQTRMYRTFSAMWQGWTKNLYPLMGGTPSRMLGEVFAVFPVGEVVLIALVCWCVASGYWPAAWSSLLLFAVLLLLRGLRLNFSLYRNLRPLVGILYYVPGVCLYSAALLSSWWKNTRARVLWKGRSYPPVNQAIDAEIMDPRKR